MDAKDGSPATVMDTKAMSLTKALNLGFTEYLPDTAFLDQPIYFYAIFVTLCPDDDDLMTK
jgi:hypothetical protein